MPSHGRLRIALPEKSHRCCTSTKKNCATMSVDSAYKLHSVELCAVSPSGACSRGASAQKVASNGRQVVGAGTHATFVTIGVSQTQPGCCQRSLSTKKVCGHGCCVLGADMGKRFLCGCQPESPEFGDCEQHAPLLQHPRWAIHADTQATSPM